LVVWVVCVVCVVCVVFVIEEVREPPRAREARESLRRSKPDVDSRAASTDVGGRTSPFVGSPAAGIRRIGA
jgi:hypothetical protein